MLAVFRVGGWRLAALIRGRIIPSIGLMLQLSQRIRLGK
jgi:hypothetical protein